MEINFSPNKIEFEKELNKLDILALEFSQILNKLNINYIIFSGYVAILFGRSRSSEDIDLLLEKISSSKFNELWKELSAGFECINTSLVEEAYNNYLSSNIPLRFAKPNTFEPNIKIKFPKTELDLYSLDKKIEISLNNNKFYTSPLELQISFKLFLGSEKDIEDAKFLYNIFKDKINIHLLNEFNRKLKVIELFNNYLK